MLKRGKNCANKPSTRSDCDLKSVWVRSEFVDAESFMAYVGQCCTSKKKILLKPVSIVGEEKEIFCFGKAGSSN